MALTQTYLELAPEFGGTRFGPFKNLEIRLGSDPDSNDIVLPESLGVLPNHVKLISQGDGSFIVAPIERTAGVFTFRSGGSPKQVTSPIAIQGGHDPMTADAFALVSQEGPRFYVLLIQSRGEQKTKESDFDRAKKRLSGKSLMAEIQRQGLVTFLTTRGGAEVQRWTTFITTGAILRPRYLVSGVAVMAGWLFAGGLGLVACQSALGAAKVQKDLDGCRTDVALLSGGDGDRITLETHTARILGDGTLSTSWRLALKNDPEFLDEYRKELANLLASDARRERLRWVYRRQNSDFTRVRTAMLQARWPAEAVRVLPYIAALEGTGENREWTFIEMDSLGKEACGRGPMAITWRQAHQLGLSNVSLDAPMAYQLWGAAGADDKQNALKGTAASLRGFATPDDLGSIHRRPADNQQDVVCMFNGNEDVPDDPRSRDNLRELIDGLGSTLGPSAKGVPPVDSTLGLQSRLLRFYAADYNGDMTQIDLSRGDSMPSMMLNEAKRVKPYAMQQAAAALAKAVAIPCLARLDRDYDELPIDKTIGKVPDPLDCIIIEGMLRYNVK
jgi:hypothetical protein